MIEPASLRQRLLLWPLLPVASACEFMHGPGDA
jgi:hypothetical protein